MASVRSNVTASPVPTSNSRLGREPELRSLLGARASEARALRDHLAEAQRECARLQLVLRDREGELAVAAKATASASQQLGTQAVRQGLVLAAGVERYGAERAALEDELQRMERVLYDRDQEILRLRNTARDLDASRLQGEMEIRSLAAAREAAASEARALGAGVSELAARMEVGGMGAPQGPSHSMVVLLEEAERTVHVRADEHAGLRARAESLTAEARRLEAEESRAAQLVADFDQALRERQRQMELEDKRAAEEGAMLRERNEQLRAQLEREQREALDQSTNMQKRTAVEAEAVRHEVAEIVAIMPKLASRLYANGRHVYSLMVPGDPVDMLLHDYLRSCGPRGNPAPALICRLGQGEYIVDGARVSISESQGGLMVREGAGALVMLRDFVRRHAPPPPQLSDALPTRQLSGMGRDMDATVIF